VCSIMPRYGRLGRVHVKMAAASFRFILCRRQFFWLQIQMPGIGGLFGSPLPNFVKIWPDLGLPWWKKGSRYFTLTGRRGVGYGERMPRQLRIEYEGPRNAF